MCKLWYYNLQVMRTLKTSSLGNWWKTSEVIIFGHPIATIVAKFGQVLYGSQWTQYTDYNTQEHLLRNMFRNTSRTSGTCCKPIGNLMGTQWELHGNKKKKTWPLIGCKIFFWSTSVLCHRSPDLPLLMLGLGMN